MKRTFLILYFAVVIVIGFTGGWFLYPERINAGPTQGYPQTPLMIDSAISPSFTTNQVAMSATVAAIKAAPSAGGFRYSITVKNVGANTVWIGSTSSVTKSTGYPLGINESYTFDRSYSAVYGICDTALTSTAAYIEEAK